MEIVVTFSNSEGLMILYDIDENWLKKSTYEIDKKTRINTKAKKIGITNMKDINYKWIL